MFTRPWHRIAGALAVPVLAAGMVLIPPGQTTQALTEKASVTIVAPSRATFSQAGNPTAGLSRQTPQSTAVLAPRIVAFDWARTKLGCPYVWGGTGPCWAGYDCSGLVMTAWDHAHIYLPRTTYEMAVSWHLVRIPRSEARRGDVILFFSGGVAFHAGLSAYLDRWMIDAPEPGESVRFDRINWGDPVFYRVR